MKKFESRSRDGLLIKFLVELRGNNSYSDQRQAEEAGLSAFPSGADKSRRSSRRDVIVSSLLKKSFAALLGWLWLE